MTNDIDVQFLCKDCERYNLCLYYHGRKETSYICKYFHTKHKTGHWIAQASHWWKCSECGRVTTENDKKEYQSYCSRCGARIEREVED